MLSLLEAHGLRKYCAGGVSLVTDSTLANLNMHDKCTLTFTLCWYLLVVVVFLQYLYCISITVSAAVTGSYMQYLNHVECSSA